MSRASRLAGAALLLMVACAPDISLPTEVPPGVKFLQVTGEWSYSATEIRRIGVPSDPPCEITGVTLRLDQIPTAGAFSGRSSGGTLVCTGELALFSGPLASLPIQTGYTFNEFVAFDFGSADWRHDGRVSTSDSVNVTSMTGTFTVKGGSVELRGEFMVHRRAR